MNDYCQTIHSWKDTWQSYLSSPDLNDAKFYTSRRQVKNNPATRKQLGLNSSQLKMKNQSWFYFTTLFTRQVRHCFNETVWISDCRVWYNDCESENFASCFCAILSTFHGVGEWPLVLTCRIFSASLLQCLLCGKTNDHQVANHQKYYPKLTQT